MPKTIVLALANHSIPGDQRALFLKYSEMRDKILAWKIHNTTRAKNGAWDIFPKATCSGENPNTTGAKTTLYAPGHETATFESKKPIGHLQKGDLCIYYTDRMVFDAKVMLVGGDELYTQPEREKGPKSI